VKAAHWSYNISPFIGAKGGPKVKAAADGEERPDTFRMNQAGLKGQGLAMENFARYVAGKLGLVAVDETGLKGVSQKINVRMLMIDSVERASEN
jgi:hypothetical protein